MNQYFVYTDGSCLGNPGKGGYAYIVMLQEHPILSIKGCAIGHTTNNRAELSAVISAMEYLKETLGEADRAQIFSDSQLIVSAINEGWLESWQKQNSERINKDLWNALYANWLGLRTTVTVSHVKAHSTNILNNLCDKIARLCAKYQCTNFNVTGTIPQIEESIRAYDKANKQQRKAGH